MDFARIDTASYITAVRDLALVNRLSLGYRPTLRFVRQLKAKDPPLRIVDIGCGYGDQLRAIGRDLARRRVAAELVGVDLKRDIAGIAPSFEAEGVSLRFVTEDGLRFAEREKPDAVISSLFMHHLDEEDIIRLLMVMDANTGSGWFVNDLYRSRLASWGFETLTKALSLHPYVRFDGPVSFSRAFRQADWQDLFVRSGIAGADVCLHHPYRLCVQKLHG